MNLARGQRGVADNLSTVINSGRELDVHIGGRSDEIVTINDRRSLSGSLV